MIQRPHWLIEDASWLDLDVHQHGGVLDYYWPRHTLVGSRDNPNFQILLFNVLYAVCLVVLIPGLLHLQLLG